MTNLYGRQLLVSFALKSRSPQPTVSSSLTAPPCTIFTQKALLTNQAGKVFVGSNLKPYGSRIEVLLEFRYYEDHYTSHNGFDFPKISERPIVEGVWAFSSVFGDSWNINDWNTLNLAS